MKAIFKREFLSYFRGPVGFVILAAFSLFSALFFSVIYAEGTPKVETVIGAMSTVVIFAVPFITMKLLSEDRRQKVDQALLTAPVKTPEIVLGKFFAALCLLALGFSFTLIFQIVVTFYVTVNWLIYLYALLGILLLGSVLISIGMFFSSITESSVVAAALTFAVFLFDMLIGSYAATLNNTVFTAVANAVSFIDRFEGFTSGILNVTDIVYMLSITVLFLFFTNRMVERRRWA